VIWLFAFSIFTVSALTLDDLISVDEELQEDSSQALWAELELDSDELLHGLGPFP
jgi:hypothetical protein